MLNCSTLKVKSNPIGNHYEAEPVGIAHKVRSKLDNEIIKSKARRKQLPKLSLYLLRLKPHDL